MGTFTVLASGARRARTIAIEPVPNAVRWLRDNVALNRIGDLVDIRQIGIGAESGVLAFSTDNDTTNHVMEEGESENCVLVGVETLDSVCRGKCPNLIKIDVEGYEASVLAGGKKTLENDNLNAVIVELNGSGARYGNLDEDVHRTLVGFEFQPFGYEPINRRLIPGENPGSENMIYVRDPVEMAERLAGAEEFSALGYSI